MTAGGSGAGVADSGTSSVTITGTIAQINALLNTDGTSTVSYIDNTDDPSASAALTLLIHDNGNTGGGDLSASDTATINITAVNDAPGLTNVAPTGDYTENAVPVTLAPGIFLTDPDPFPHGAPGGNGSCSRHRQDRVDGFVAGDELLVFDHERRDREHVLHRHQHPVDYDCRPPTSCRCSAPTRRRTLATRWSTSTMSSRMSSSTPPATIRPTAAATRPAPSHGRSRTPAEPRTAVPI